MAKISDSDLKDILVNPVLNSRGQYVCDCVFCGKPRHMYVSKLTQAFDCKKCGEAGSVYKLLRFFNKLYLLEWATIEVRQLIKTVSEISEDDVEEIVLEELPIVRLPAGWKLFGSTDYLKKRGLSTEQIKHYKFGETSLISKYENYVIFPIFDNGKIRGFIGRYASKKVPKDKLRYNNSSGTNFSKLLDGFDEIIKGVTTTVK